MTFGQTDQEEEADAAGICRLVGKIADLERAAETTRAEHAAALAEAKRREDKAIELTVVTHAGNVKLHADRETLRAELVNAAAALGLATARIRELDGAFAELAALFPPVPAQSDDDEGEPYTCGKCFAIVSLDEGCEADRGDPCHYCAQAAYAEARAIVARIEKAAKGTT